MYIFTDILDTLTHLKYTNKPYQRLCEIQLWFKLQKLSHQWEGSAVSGNNRKKNSILMNTMDYQQLPPVSTMNIGPPTPAPSPHIQIMQNNNNQSQQNNNTNNNNNTSILTTMQPPILPVGMPLQVVHNLQHLTQQQQQNNNSHNNNNNNHHNSQNLPPPSALPPSQQQQLLQAIHHNNNNNNNTNNNNINNHNPNQNTNEDGSRWTQYQVQQLWRHHAYLNGNVNQLQKIERILKL